MEDDEYPGIQDMAAALADPEEDYSSDTSNGFTVSDDSDDGFVAIGCGDGVVATSTSRTATTATNRSIPRQAVQSAPSTGSDDSFAAIGCGDGVPATSTSRTATIATNQSIARHAVRSAPSTGSDNSFPAIGCGDGVPATSTSHTATTAANQSAPPPASRTVRSIYLQRWQRWRQRLHWRTLQAIRQLHRIWQLTRVHVPFCYHHHQPVRPPASRAIRSIYWQWWRFRCHRLRRWGSGHLHVRTATTTTNRSVLREAVRSAAANRSANRSATRSATPSATRCATRSASWSASRLALSPSKMFSPLSWAPRCLCVWVFGRVCGGGTFGASSPSKMFSLLTRTYSALRLVAESLRGFSLGGWCASSLPEMLILLGCPIYYISIYCFRYYQSVPVQGRCVRWFVVVCHRSGFLCYFKQCKF